MPDQFEDSFTHYRATPKGTELLTADRDWWPFDDEGELRLKLEASGRLTSPG